jgi:serine/threonine protein kinase
MLHHDLKPSNVLVVEQRVVVLDFGLMRELDASGATLTEAWSAAGTPAYMAPEQIMAKPLTAASDWYAFGVMLYQAISGSFRQVCAGRTISAPRGNCDGSVGQGRRDRGDRGSHRLILPIAMSSSASNTCTIVIWLWACRRVRAKWHNVLDATLRRRFPDPRSQYKCSLVMVPEICCGSFQKICGSQLAFRGLQSRELTC